MEEGECQVLPLGGSSIQHRGGFIQELWNVFAWYDADSDKRVLPDEVVIKDGQNKNGTFFPHILSFGGSSVEEVGEGVGGRGGREG